MFKAWHHPRDRAEHSALCSSEAKVTEHTLSDAEVGDTLPGGPLGASEPGGGGENHSLASAGAFPLPAKTPKKSFPMGHLEYRFKDGPHV